MPTVTFSLPTPRDGRAGSGRDARGGVHHERVDPRDPLKLHRGEGVAQDYPMLKEREVEQGETRRAD